MEQPLGKKFIEKLKTHIDEWDDEECLKAIIRFFPRIEIGSELVQNKETGLITHQIMTIQCGDKGTFSEPLALEWPLQPADLPEEAKEAGVAVN